MVLVKMKETAEQYLNKKVKYVLCYVISNLSSNGPLAMLSSLFPPTSMTRNGKRPKTLARLPA